MRSTVLAALVVTSLAVGCDGATAEPPDVTTSGTAPLDGFLVMENATPPGIYLVDPATGTPSNTVWPLSALESRWSLSPDGQQLAFIGPDGQGGHALRVATATLVAGAPELEVLREVPLGNGLDLVWTPDGDRLHGAQAYLDPATGEVRGCRLYDGEPLPVTGFIALPGSHDYLCRVEAGQWRRFSDGRFVGTVHGDGALSPDGQLLGLATHLPSNTTRVANQADLETSEQATDPRLPLPDGTVVALRGGGHGDLVREYFVGLEVSTERITVTDPPSDGRILDLAAPFDATGALAAPATWSVADALEPWLTEGEGRRYEPLFTRADGQGVVYRVLSHRIETTIVADKHILSEVPVASALVEIARDGTARGFVTRTAQSGLVLLADATRVLDLGGDDWLVGGVAQGDNTPTWAGYLGGAPVAYSRTGEASADGRWLFGLDDGQLCLRAVAEPGALRCFPSPLQGRPVAVLGAGVKPAHAEDPPRILGLSRAVAPPGGEIAVFGAHLGVAGELRVGDARVPDEDVLSWTADAIRFRMSDVLPERGAVRVTTDAGDSAGGRAFVVGRSRPVASPFGDVPAAPPRIAQGLNRVDLGTLPAGFTGDPTAAELRVTPEARLSDGRYLVFHAGGPPGIREVAVRSGDYERVISLEAVAGLADADAWQPVRLEPVGAADRVAFVTLAGDLVERSQGRHPIVSGDGVAFADIAQRVAAGDAYEYGMPDFFRSDDGRTFVANDADPSPALGPPWSFRELLGFTDDAGAWGIPRFADRPQAALPLFHRHFGIAGETVVFVGQDPFEGSGAAYTMSYDYGVTLQPTTVVPEAVLPVSFALREPVTVRAAGGTFFLVFEADYSGAPPSAVHAVGLDGSFTPDVIDLPPGVAISSASAADQSPLLEATDGGRVLLHFARTSTMVLADFDAAEPTWTVVPSAADQGRVRNFWRDDESGDVFAVLTDGAIMGATRAGGWADWAEVDLGVDLGDAPVEVVPAAVAKIDGRWLVLAQWRDPATHAAPSALGPGAWLLGPRLSE